MLVLIGIDDTDNLQTKGTGYRARKLAEKLAEQAFGIVTGITRHQLYVSPEIPYTSHNSSLCIGLEADGLDKTALVQICSEFLAAESAEGSDPGLCIAYAGSIGSEAMEFGKAAKSRVLTKSDAERIAHEYRLHLSEHGGTGGGIIGALAGVALRAWGNDGRYVWLKGIREMEGSFSADEIFTKSGVKRIMTEHGEEPENDHIVNVGDWFRPVLLDGKPTLLVEKCDTEGCWRILEPTYIKARY